MRTTAVAQRIEMEIARKKDQLAAYGIELPTDLPEKFFLNLAQGVLSFVEQGNFLFGSRLSPQDRAEVYKKKQKEWGAKLVRLVNSTGGPIGRVWYIHPTQPHVIPIVSRTTDIHQQHERHENSSFLAIISRANGEKGNKHRLSTLEVVGDGRVGM